MFRLLQVMWPFKTKKTTKEVQTIICVQPHVLESNKVKAKVLRESKNQTLVTFKPDADEKFVYSSLEYTPYQYIQQGGIRTLDLPRKLRLHFSRSFSLDYEQCLWDDDGVNELCIDLKNRAKTHARHEAVDYVNEATQTIS